MLRPYKIWKTDKLIKEYNKINNQNGEFYPIAIFALVITILWIYLKIAFLITIILLIIKLILLSSNKDSYDMKNLMKKELDRRTKK